MPAAPSPRPPAAVSPSPGPNPLGRRLWLGIKLLLVPVALVCLPSLFVSYFFGSRPQPKDPPDSALAPLRASLERAAREKLPDGPAATFGARFDALTLRCPPAEADARIETLRGLAARCGGTLTEQAADAAGRHLVVDLPGDQATSFRQAAVRPGDPVPPEPGPAAAANTRVFFNLTLAEPVPTPPGP